MNRFTNGRPRNESESEDAENDESEVAFQFLRNNVLYSEYRSYKTPHSKQ